MYVYIQNSSKPGNKSLAGYLEIIFVIAMVALSMFLCIFLLSYSINGGHSEVSKPAMVFPPIVSSSNLNVMEKYQSCIIAANRASRSCALQAVDVARAQGRSEGEIAYLMSLLGICESRCQDEGVPMGIR